MSTKRKAPSKITAPVKKASVRQPTKASIDESNATISSVAHPRSGLGEAEPIEISSDSSSDYSLNPDDEDLDVDNGTGLQSPAESPQEETEKPEHSSGVNGDNSDDRQLAPLEPESMQDAAREAEADGATDATDSEVDNGPTFGELLRGQETVDVGAILGASSQSRALVKHESGSLGAPAVSLATTLSQALRTDDHELLESCLATLDANIVRSTIERLDSNLAIALLTSLATRLHRRPGRAGSLMQWVQWTLVAHGGALAAQPQALAKLSSLQKVLAERARGLNSLLILKGKLDLLESQLQLRKRMARAASPVPGDGDEEDLIVDEEVIDVNAKLGPSIGSKRKRDADLGDEDDVPVTNGIGGDSDDEEEEEHDEDDEDVDDEQSVDEDEVDHDDKDESMGEDDESDVEAPEPPAKLQKTSKTFSKRKIQA